MKQISFTQEVKEEIATFDYDNISLKALLSGFVKVNGNVVFSNRKPSLSLRTENAKIAKLLFKGFQTIYGINPTFTYSRKIKLDKGVVFYVTINEDVDSILKDLEIMDGYFPIYPSELAKGDNLRHFIAGAFLASGSVNSPQSHNYHLQFTVSSEEDSAYFLKLLNRFKRERNMDFKSISRRNKYVLYLKKADQISIFLTLCGAPIKMLDFENSRIEKDYLNSENRYQICLTANYQKTLMASKAQQEDIFIIKEKLGYKALSEKERAICEIRENNLEASLNEIAHQMQDNYHLQISRSGVNHLLKTLHVLAEKLRGNHNG